MLRLPCCVLLERLCLFDITVPYRDDYVYATLQCLAGTFNLPGILCLAGMFMFMLTYCGLPGRLCYSTVSCRDVYV